MLPVSAFGKAFDRLNFAHIIIMFFFFIVCSWPLAEGALTHSSSSSGVSVLSRSLSGLSDAWCSSTAMTPATPATPASTTLIAIGQRVGIQDYALREWQGDTKKAQTILKVM